MTIILFVSTILLNVVGIGFAGLYLWLTLYSSVSDVAVRSASARSISKMSMIFSLVFAFLTSLLSGVDNVNVAIGFSKVLYSIIAISWLIVLVACGAAILHSLLSRSSYRRDTGKQVWHIALIAIIGAGVGLLLAWLLG